MDTTTLIGVVGAGIILVFFVLNQTKVLDIDNFWYDLGNTVGSGLLVYYAVLLGSIPFIILNVVWMLFSLKDVVQSLRK
ncbi:MAG: hypothetical protein NBV63_00770 [Candidatus Pacebacteria bacterium]|nr:hypothetical protein [Candidatus Paceibacterota bacterium]